MTSVFITPNLISIRTYKTVVKHNHHAGTRMLFWRKRSRLLENIAGINPMTWTGTPVTAARAQPFTSSPATEEDLRGTIS
jgi:hypothetical protein